MNEYIHPISPLIHCTVRISCFDANGKQTSGTGYVYDFCKGDISLPCIVTNKHVLKGVARAIFQFTFKNEDGLPKIGSYESIVLENVNAFCIPHPSEIIDLVAIPIGAVLNKASRADRHYYYVALGAPSCPDAEFLNGLSPIEDIVMIGYPNGLWDEVNNYPVIRKGITATHAALNLNGKPEFLIDAACFPGSSGSPVFLANLGSYTDPQGNLVFGNRIAFLGTLWGGPVLKTTGEIVVEDIPTDTRPVAVGTIPTNLGYVISCRELAVLEVAVFEVYEKPVMRNSICMCGSGQRFKNCCGKVQ
ncbi:trypsin-like peptidase domain-containing protein [Pseudomonas cerasi]